MLLTALRVASEVLFTEAVLFLPYNLCPNLSEKQ